MNKNEDGIIRSSKFQTLLVEPLLFCVGLKIDTIKYWIAGVEQPTFDLKTPNASGLYTIDLVCDEKYLSISIGWDKKLRHSDSHYHIQASFLPIDQKTLSETLGLIEIDASSTAEWQSIISERLIAVEVLGDPYTPRAIRFEFSSSSILLITGYSGVPLILGDGDDLLVFSGEIPSFVDNEYTILWKNTLYCGD